MVLERRDKSELIGSDQRGPGGARKAMSLENMDPQGVVESSMQGQHCSIWVPKGFCMMKNGVRIDYTAHAKAPGQDWRYA